MNLGFRNSSVRAFNACELKTISTEIDDNGIAYVQCPTTEDGKPNPGWVQGRWQSSEFKKREDAIDQLARVCGTTICKGCVYAGANDILAVEDIRQGLALENQEIEKQRLINAQIRLETLELSMQADAAEQSINGSLFELPVAE